ncbi:unnamed protein product [Penicillium olsonii]|nr:unnamed protein product [Penicillium olsonii]
MRPSAVLRSPHWLTGLKATQLQRIARATGIQSSGTKGLLVERIAAQLGLQLDGDSVANPTGSIPSNASQGQDRHRNVDCGSTNNHSKGSTQNSSKLHAKPWSILSIDMGIQNLAFAHLHLPRSHGTDHANPQMPVLTAWHRLAVSEIASLNLAGAENPLQTECSSVSKSDASDKSAKGSKSKSTSKSKEVESFSPDLYAATAYNLIKSLLTAYRPTHILIERQRFRSGGASAVQEWTLRVGVFEGMLYAVLHALRMERGDVITVQGVEPRRVVRYWLDQSAAEKERLKAREVKKAKIDVVGSWISAARGEPSMDSRPIGKQQQLLLGSSSVDKILLAEPSASPALEGIVNEYMRKWQAQPKPKKTRASKGTSTPDPLPVEAIDIGKLDDLADCLLQGVAWVEWQAMRELLVRDGPRALDDI